MLGPRGRSGGVGFRCTIECLLGPFRASTPRASTAAFIEGTASGQRQTDYRNEQITASTACPLTPHDLRRSKGLVGIAMELGEDIPRILAP